MKKLSALTLGLTLLTFCRPLLADDGGYYSVAPFGAKYEKQTQSFTFIGQYAQELKKLLPPAFSVLTNMQPNLTDAYNKNFRGIFMKDAAGNALSIECNSAEQVYADNKTAIKENPDTKCTVSVLPKADAEYTPTQKLQVKDALLKAQQANQIK